MEHVDPIKGILLPYLNFFVFLTLAIVFFRKPLRAMISKDREDFENISGEAKRIHDDVRGKHQELSNRLAQIDKEVASLKTDMDRAATNEAEQIVEGAKKLVQHFSTESQRIAAAELARAKTLLRQEVVEQALAQTKQKLGSGLNQDQHHKIVETAVQQIPKLEVLS